MKNKYRIEGDICFIEVNSKGETYEVMIDIEEFYKLQYYPWTLGVRRMAKGRIGSPCFRATGKLRKTINLKDIILDPKEGYEVRFKAGSLDCRKKSLKLSPQTKELFKKELLELYYKGVSLTPADILRGNEASHLFSISKRIFKCKQPWKRACEYAGLNYDRDISKQEFKRFTDEGVLRIIQDLESKAFMYVHEDNNPLLQVAIKRFGSWRKAVELAGFDYKTLIDDTTRQFGKLKYEPFLERVLQALGMDELNPQKRLEASEGYTIPDYSLRSWAGSYIPLYFITDDMDTVIIDAKLSSHTHFNWRGSSQRERFKDSSGCINYVYLRGPKKGEELDEKTLNISIFMLIDLINDDKTREALHKEANELLTELEMIETS